MIDNRQDLIESLRLLASQVHQYAGGIDVGEELTETFNVYQVLHSLQRRGVDETFTQSINPLSNLSDDVEKMTQLLSENEWAEHIANTPLGQRLEGQITDLLNRINGSWD